MDGARWHRCLRCDSWLPVDAPRAHARAPAAPGRDRPAAARQDRPATHRHRPRRPLRRRRRDRRVVFVFVFASHRDALRHRTFRVIADLQTGTSSGKPSGHGLVHEVERAFSLQSSTLRLVGAVLAAYALVEGIEAVGLWYQRRWAEYLTFLVTTSLLPLEVYELSHRLSLIKIGTFLINLAVVAYLLVAKRLFGIRGGVAAEHRDRDRDVGWGALERNAPESVARIA